MCRSRRVFDLQINGMILNEATTHWSLKDVTDIVFGNLTYRAKTMLTILNIQVSCKKPEQKKQHHHEIQKKLKERKLTAHKSLKQLYKKNI